VRYPGVCSCSMSARCCPVWVSVMCAILGCAAVVCLLAAVLCGSPATVCPYPMPTAGGLLLWVLWRGKKQKTKNKS